MEGTGESSCEPRTLGIALLGAFLALPLVGCGAETGSQPQGVADRYVPDPPGVEVTTWVDGLRVPWDLTFLPGGGALVTERQGTIRLIRDGELRDKPYAELEVADVGEGGLMGLALHPEFPEIPHLYVMHTYRSGGDLHNRILRLRHKGDRAVRDEVILDRLPGGHFHNGGRLAFGADGLLYIAAGEAFRRHLAQSRPSLGGKILRVAPDGAIPEGNPFPDSPVYSLGHRNPQGLAWDPRTGALLASEHGPSGEVGFGAFDEINRIEKGANYGWPEVVGAPGRSGFADPLVAWPDTTTPPAGMTFHQGTLFVATLGSEALLRIDLIPRESGDYQVREIERWFRGEDGESRYGRLRDAVIGAEGALYVLTSNRDGRGRPREGDDRILRMTFPETGTP